MFFKKLYDDAILPTVGTTKSAGHDLYVYNDEVRVPSLETAVIRTGVKFSEEFKYWYLLKDANYEKTEVAVIREQLKKVGFTPYGKIEITVEPRSGLASKHDLDAMVIMNSETKIRYDSSNDTCDYSVDKLLKRMAGVCDQDYTKEIMVLIHNLHPTRDYVFKKGDKCAQMIFNVGLVDLECVQNVERDGGFGSTGK